ncbi:MAG: rhamnulokinase [Rectinemataceae bacterium]
MSKKDTSCLAFDLGGSGGKLVLCRFDGERISLEAVHRFTNEPVSANDCLYWDLWHIYRQMNEGVKRAAKLAKTGIGSIGVDAFSNDHAFIDARGELLTPLRCYRDGRTARYKDAIYAKMSPDRLYAASGNQIAPFNTLMQLAAMREAGQAHILDNAHRMLFTPDLLINFMTGEAAAEYTIASVSQMFDFGRRDWNSEILDAFEIPRGILCEIVDPGTVIGVTRESYNEMLGVSGFKVVSICEHDTASAFLAAPSEGERIIISSGTWSLVGTEVPEPIIEPLGYRYNIANEGGMEGRHRLVRNVMGLWIIQELRRQYELRGLGCDYAQMEDAAARAKPFACMIDPDAPVFFSPKDMESAIVRHCAEKMEQPPETMGEMVRCVTESLAFKYRWAVEKIEELVGRRLTVVNVVGGGSQNRLLCQFTANACNRPVLAGPDEATSLGNSLVQLLADGQISSIAEGKELVRRSFPIVEYLPREPNSWDEEYHKFVELFALP